MRLTCHMFVCDVGTSVLKPYFPATLNSAQDEYVQIWYKFMMDLTCLARSCRMMAQDLDF